MIRTMNPERLNALANHPEVRPWLGGADGPLDLTGLVSNPSVVVLEAEHGAFLLVPILPTVYELHTCFLPEGRGREFFADAAEMFRYMFTRTDCLEIVTKVPDDNGGAGLAAGRTGFKERFHRADAWKPGVGISFRSLTCEAWALRCEAAQEEGERFHDVLEAAKIEVGSDAPVHADDATHDHIVGAALLMAYAGNLAKGVDFYNMWSPLAGYATIAVVGPNILDIGDALIEVRDGRVGVLQCRSAPSRQQRESEAP